MWSKIYVYGMHQCHLVTYTQVLASSCARDAKLESHVKFDIGLQGAGTTLCLAALCTERRVSMSSLLMVGGTLQPGASRLETVCS